MFNVVLIHISMHDLYAFVNLSILISTTDPSTIPTSLAMGLGIRSPGHLSHTKFV